MDYHRCSRKELKKFARDRGIDVPKTSTDRHERQRAKRDLIAALEEADSNPSFRFLDLPPELRNMVYRELLVLQPEPIQLHAPEHHIRTRYVSKKVNQEAKCHPQILCASKKLNSEATGILHGNNSIVVKVDRWAVKAHGVHCGTYKPQPKLHGFHAGHKSAEKLVWPDFLRRARNVKLVVVDMLDLRKSWDVLPNCGTIHNILFSLCLFLRQRDSLRTLTIDLTWLAHQFVGLGRTDRLQQYLPTAIYPLRLLRDSVETQVTGIEVLPLQQPLTANTEAVELADRIASGSTRTAFRQLQAASRLLCLIQQSKASTGTGDKLEVLLLGGLALTFAGCSFLYRGHSGALMRVLCEDLTDLRDEVDRVGMDWVPKALEKRPEGMLMLGVELERVE